MQLPVSVGFFFFFFFLIIYFFVYEQARSDLIPGIVTLLQKQWRGYLCRRRYKKMKAALVIMDHYRRYKRYAYIKELERKFKNAKSMRDYGKSLTWPQENFSVRSAVPALRIMFARWRAWMILKAIPREDWPQLRLKVNIYNSKLQNSMMYIFCTNGKLYRKNGAILFYSFILF